MSDPDRPLDLARADLERRLHAADGRNDGPEAAVLRPLAEIADMVCRIGDQPYSAHYRAEKAGPLMASAVKLQVTCLANYAGSADERARAALDEAGEVLGDVGRAVRDAMWAIAGPGRVTAFEADDARRLRAVAAGFSAWAERTALALSAPASIEPGTAGRSGPRRR